MREVMALSLGYVRLAGELYPENPVRRGFGPSDWRFAPPLCPVARGYRKVNLVMGMWRRGSMSWASPLSKRPPTSIEALSISFNL